MGKRRSNISGLARFVSETAGVASPQLAPSPSSRAVANDESSESPGGKDNRGSTDTLDTRPKKRAKLQIGLLGPGLERYDATGFVPFYTEGSQVPPRLQKCTLTYYGYFLFHICI